MRGRLLCFLVGRPGIRRTITMKIMGHLRRTRQPSELLPNYSFLRTIQSPSHTFWDELYQEYRLSTGAFKASTSDKTVSGDLEQLLVADEVPVSEFQSSLARVVGLYAIQIQKIRDQALTVSHLPVLTDWYHGGIAGNLKPRSIREKLRDDAVAIIKVDQELAASYHATNRSGALVGSGSRNFIRLGCSGPQKPISFLAKAVRTWRANPAQTDAPRRATRPTG
jgi:hypothetical protein